MRKKENPVDHVLDRMVEAVLGENAHFKSHAEVLGVPAETIKSWRRRGEVPASKLAAFAQDWKVSVDWLLYGPEEKLILGDNSARLRAAERAAVRYGALTDEERKLLENYRKSPDEVKEALQLVASIASRPVTAAGVPCPPRVKVRSGSLPDKKFSPPVGHAPCPGARPGRKRAKGGGA